MDVDTVLAALAALLILIGLGLIAHAFMLLQNVKRSKQAAASRMPDKHISDTLRLFAAAQGIKVRVKVTVQLPSGAFHLFPNEAEAASFVREQLRNIRERR